MDSLTDVPGLQVGHATDPGGTGCTVVLGPFRAAVEVRGMATGSRELGVLTPEHLVDRADALFLTGGSALGLSVGDGVSRWLRERGCGFETGAGVVPIVPGAVIFDLAEGRPVPDADFGYAACEAATSDSVPVGRVGAGTGASSGKILGREHTGLGGLGSASESAGAYRVGALVVVNPFGDVLDASGRVVEGPRDSNGGLVDTAARIAEGGASPEIGRVGTNTTLAVVATDAPLDPVQLTQVARIAANAVTRRIRPVHTPFDGDLVFSVGTAEAPAGLPVHEVVRIGVLAERALERSIDRAIAAAREESR